MFPQTLLQPGADRHHGRVPEPPLSHRPGPGEGHGPRHHQDGSESTPASHVPPQGLLNRALASRVAGTEQTSIYAPDHASPPEDLSPDKVAGRIISAIAARLSAAGEAGAGGERLLGLLDEARSGVDQGFRAARETLSGLGLLTDASAGEIDQTYRRVQDGLATLAEQVRGADPAQEPPPAASPAPASEAAASVLSVARSEAVSLEVRTRDGDLVTLSIARRASATSASVLAAGDRTALAARQDTRGLELSLQYQVQGQLDQGERAALDDLFGRVDGVADQFFQGDLQDALGRALDLGYDGRELAGFSLRLSQTQTASLTTAYQAVGRLDGAAGAPAPGDRVRLQPLGELAATLRKAHDGLQGLFDQADRLLVDTLSAAIRTDPRHAQPSALERAHGRSLEDLAGDLAKVTQL